MYRHGIYVSEQETSMIAPLNGTAGLQVVIGTAPVHLLADPAAAINKPLLVYSKAEAIAAVGHSDDFASFTLCEAISASFAVVNVAPLVLINVLDPAKHSAEMEEKLRANRFTLQDFYDQMVQMKSMGSMEEILAQMPGGGNLKGVKLDEKAMAHTEAIILSMTPKEREKPEIIGASRKKRIAAGAGLKVEDVNRLLKSFEQMRKLIKQFSGPGAGKKMKRMRGLGGFRGFPGM